MTTITSSLPSGRRETSFLAALASGQRPTHCCAGRWSGQRGPEHCATLSYSTSSAGVVHIVSAPVFFRSTVTGSSICSDVTELFAVPGYVGLPRLLRLTVDAKLRDACFESVLSLATKRRRLHITDPEGLILKILQVYSKLCAPPYLNLAFLLASTQSFIDLQLPHAFIRMKTEALPYLASTSFV
ncbi:hypothetical protein ECG_05754 [Echinococcus granulosus]|nr:hypothetical protein ECG_05754 [Echinococcus granulosus]